MYLHACTHLNQLVSVQIRGFASSLPVPAHNQNAVAWGFRLSYSTLDVEFTAKLKFTQAPHLFYYLCNGFLLFCTMLKYSIVHIVPYKSFVSHSSRYVHLWFICIPNTFNNLCIFWFKLSVLWKV